MALVKSAIRVTIFERIAKFQKIKVRYKFVILFELHHWDL